MEEVRHKVIGIEPGDDLVLDAYMSGMRIRDHLGHSLI
jgi:hypothetical protein